MNEFTQQFAYITADDLADKMVSNSERNQVKYYLINKCSQLKRALYNLEQKQQQSSDDELVKGAISMGGHLVQFFENLHLTSLKSVIQQKVNQIRLLIEYDITDLLCIRYVGVSRARILKQAGFHSAEDIVAAGFDKFKLLVNFGEGGDMAV